MEKIEVEQVIMPDVANDTMTYEEVMDDIEKENVPVEHPKVGEEFGFGDATLLCFVRKRIWSVQMIPMMLQ